MHQVGVINYGSGNFASVWNALRHLQIDAIEISQPEQMNLAERLILPGVGAFHSAMEKLQSLHLIEAMKQRALVDGRPFLGICVGMQLLAELGHEFQECQGLGWVAGEVKRFDVAHQGLPVPHMGWNEVTLHHPSPLFAQMEESPSFYFVHSYRFEPTDERNVLASCEYGEKFAACVQRNNVFGVQFHPEKSQRDGLALLANFCSLN